MKQKTYKDYIEEDNFYSGNYEVDGNRNTPIDTLIIHHSAGTDMTDWSDVQVVDSISSFHKQRFYQNGLINPRHTHRFKSEPVYCAYHFLARYMTGYGEWRFTPTMYGIEKNVAGGTSLYLINRKAVQVCILGDYRNVLPSNNFVDSFVYFFMPFAKEIKEQNIDLEVQPHKAFDDTTCPGLIADLIPEIREKLLD